MHNTVIVKSTNGKSFTFIEVDRGEKCLTDIKFPDGTILALATKDNLRNVKGIDFWDTNIIFAAISNNLADVMTHTDANQTFWDMLLMYHSDDPSEIEECFEVVSDFVRITQKKMANKP